MASGEFMDHQHTNKTPFESGWGKRFDLMPSTEMDEHDTDSTLHAEDVSTVPAVDTVAVLRRSYGTDRLGFADEASASEGQE
jgi:hypothetical protein